MIQVSQVFAPHALKGLKLLAQGVLLLELLGLQPVLKPYAKVQLLSQKIEDNRLQIVQTIVFFLCYLFNFSSSAFQKVFLFLPTKSYNSNLIHFVYAEILYVDLYTGIAAEHDLHGSSFSTCGRLYTSGNGK